MNDISYLKNSQKTRAIFKPKEFFSNQTFIVPLSQKPNNKESFRILSSKDYANKKSMTCEPDKICEILRTTKRITEIKVIKQPLVQNKTSYMNIAKKITAFNSKNIKRIKTNTPLTFHFEKTERNTTYIDILRKTFNKGVPSPRNSSISNLSNKENVKKEKFATILRKPQISARNKTQEKKPLNNGIQYQISSKRIPTETFNDQKLCVTTSNNLQKGISDRLAIPKLKIGQMNFLNRNLVRKEGENTSETTNINSSSLNIYDKNSISEYKFEKTLGQGSYATVKLAFEKATNKKFAIKIYEKYRLTDHHRMNNVRREISILKKIDHKNIIKLYYALDEKRQIFLITEYIGAMSLHAYLKSKPFRKLEEREAKKLFYQIVQALDYCHSKNIVHRDIKLENILLDEKMTIKIIDFGFSIIIPSNKKLNIFCGTPSYMAPEIVNKMMYNGHATDVWALGILLYVLLHGNFPFKGVDDKDLFRRIGKGRFEINENLSKESKGLLQMILKVNPNERVSTHQILQNSWFF